MKIIEFHVKQDNHENHIIPYNNYENHENLTLPCDNYENHKKIIAFHSRRITRIIKNL